MSEDSRSRALANPLILDKIFSHLCPADIRTVALVSRSVTIVTISSAIVFIWFLICHLGIGD